MRSLFFLFALSINLLSCNNHYAESEKGRVLKEFDSVNKSLNNSLLSDTDEIIKAFNTVNRSLEKTSNTIFRSSAILYDSLERKLSVSGGFGKIRQLYYGVNDFCSYLSDLEMRFKIACGDSTGEALPEESTDNIRMTNNFFLKKGPADFLLPKMKDLKTAFFTNTKDVKLTGEINKLDELPYGSGKEHKSYMKAYFHNAPPVAAITMLHKIENDIRNIENQLLKDYLKE
jgi:hypothetical protein